MKKQLFISLVATVLFLAPQTWAAEPTPAGCQPIYNGGDTCSNNSNLTINKKVLKPGAVVTPGKSVDDSQFIENIGPNDPAYPTNTLTAFRIYVTNTSRSTLKNITVKDILPPRYVTFVTGSNGKFDETSRTFTATIDQLKSKETKAFTIQVITSRPENLPTDGSSLCTINMALASVNNKTSQDTAQLCVSPNGTPPQLSAAIVTSQTTKGGLTAPTPPTKAVTPGSTTKGGLAVAQPATPQPGQNTPGTGPETLVLAGLLPTGALGWLLRRRTS